MQDDSLYSRDLIVPAEQAGMRLDQCLASLCPEHSRSRLTDWLKAGHIQVDGQSLRAKDKVQQGMRIVIQAPVLPVEDFCPQAMDIPIVFEDDSLIVVNKPADLVVHPAAGNPSGTLLNGLLHHCPKLVNLPRAGIVHRLDKGTTGLMVVAKTLEAHTHLVAHLQARTIKRVYHAIVLGQLRAQEGQVDAPIGRHPTQRVKMAVVPDGKPAKTYYQVTHSLQGGCALTVRLETGRTHQIRVHMAHIGHPLLGDATYGGTGRFPAGLSEVQREAIKAFSRPALHAKALSFTHPANGELVEFQAPLPEDIQQIQQVLQV